MMASNYGGNGRQNANMGRQNQPNSSANDENLTLYVKHISKTISRDTLKGLFEQYGEVVDFRVDFRDDFPTYRAHVQMDKMEQCVAAVTNLNGYMTGNSKFYVEFQKAFVRARTSPSAHRPQFNRQLPSGRGRGSAMLLAANRSPPRHPTPGQYGQPVQPPRGGYTRRAGRGACNSPRQPYRSPFNSSVCQKQQHGLLAVDVSSVEVERCLLCHAVSTQRCSVCKTARYCSRECQSTHWEQCHKFECSPVRTPSLSGSTVDIAHSNHLENRRTVSGSDTDSVSSASEEPRLPLNELLPVKLTDFESPSQFFVQRSDTPNTAGKLPRVWECSLRGVAPSDAGKWSEEVMSVCAANGLALGGPCKLICHSRKGGVYQTSLSLRNGVDLASKLCEAGVAILTETTKYKVSTSTHRLLKTGEPIHILIDVSSIKGVSEFYAQVFSPALLKDVFPKFVEMSPKLTHYSQHIANKPPPHYKAENDDYVLAPFENEWYRGLVTAASDVKVVVSFIDYGNVSAFTHRQIMPMSKQFINVPAIAVRCQLHGVLDLPTEHQRRGAIEQIKALSGEGSKVQAVVKIVGKNHLTLDVLDLKGCNFSDSLVKAGLALSAPQIDPQESAGDLSPLRSPAVRTSAPLASAREITVNDEMPPLMLANESMASRQPANKRVASRQPANERVAPHQSANESVASRQPANERVASRQPAIERVASHQSANESVASRQPTNKSVAPHQPANDDMPPLLRVGNDTPLLPATCGESQPLLTNSKKTLLSPANHSTPSPQLSNENQPLGRSPDLQPANQPIKRSSSKQTGERRPSPATSQPLRKPKDGSKVRKNTASRFKATSESARSKMYERDIAAATLDLSAPTKVLLVNATDLHSIYVSPCDRESMIRFLESMATVSQSCLSEDSLPPEGDLVEGEVLFALEPITQEWDRVVVLKVDDQPLVLVRSLDFGNSYEVAKGNVRVMSSEAALLPKLAVKVNLLGVKGSLNQEGQDLLLSFVKGIITVEPKKVKDEVEYEMHSQQFGNINEMLKRHLVATETNENGLDSHARSKMYERDIAAATLDLSAPTKVLLVNATDLHSIYVSPCDRESMIRFLESMATVSQSCLSEDSLPPEGDLVEGEVLFALEPITQEWDRVVVLKVADQPLVLVRSLDFGNSYEVAKGNVRVMSSEATLLHKLAVKVNLLGVKGSLNQEGKELLLSLVKGIITVEPKKVKDEVEYEMHSQQFGNINEMLKRHLVATETNENGLDSHGSSSDVSLPAISPDSPPSPYCHGDDLATQEARLNQQIIALRAEKVQLQQEITLLKQKPLRRRSELTSSEQCEEFTL